MTEKKQTVIINDRHTLTISGVAEIISYTGQAIVLYTVMGNVKICGTELEVDKAFSEKGSVEICGNVKSVFFSDNDEKFADNFISRIFR